MSKQSYRANGKGKTQSTFRKMDDPIIKEQMIEALEDSLGIITTACKTVGISRDTFYLMYQNDDEFAKRVDAVNDYTMDFVEGKLLNAIRMNDHQMIRFYMKSKGKKRGYGSNLDITTNGNNISNVTVDIIYTPKKDENDGKP